MKNLRKLLLVFGVVVLFTTSCKKDTDISANLTWEDDSYYDFNDAKWKICIYDEALFFISDDDYNKTPFETKDIAIGTKTVLFTTEVKSYGSFTVVAFYDSNGDGKFTKSEYCKVEFDGVDAGEALTFDMNIVY